MGLPGIPSIGQAGPQRGAVCMLPGSGWGPTSHIGPQGHLVVVDNPSRSGAPEVGPKAVVVHLRGAESALEARTSFTGDNQNIAQPPPRGAHPRDPGVSGPRCGVQARPDLLDGRVTGAVGQATQDAAF